MKTRKTFLVYLSFLCLGFTPILVMGQSLPHTFSANTSAKASEVNANFTYLLERFGLRKTTVDCSNPSASITNALKNYNHIVITGKCTENLDLDPPSNPHRLVILEGLSSHLVDGIRASDSSKPVVEAKGPFTIVLEKLQLTGGSVGFLGLNGPTIVLENLLVEGNSQDGIVSYGGTKTFIEDSTIRNNGKFAIVSGGASFSYLKNNTITGHTNQGSILIESAASAFIDNNTITGSKYNGIEIATASSAKIRNNTITGSTNGGGIRVRSASNAILERNIITGNSGTGLSIDENSTVTLAGGDTISGNSGRAIDVHAGSNLHMWCDQQLTSPTTISANSSNDAIKAGLNSTLNLCNLTLTSPQKVGIRVGGGSSIYLRNMIITGSTDYGIRAFGAKVTADNVTITGSGNAEIKSFDSTTRLRNSTIAGTAGENEIKLYFGSKLFIESGTTITGTINCNGNSNNTGHVIDNNDNVNIVTTGCQ